MAGIGVIRGVTFVLIITIVAYFGGIWLLTPSLVLLLFSVSLYRRFNDWNVATWFCLVSVSIQDSSDVCCNFFHCCWVYEPKKALFELVFRVRVKISGDRCPLEGPCVIVLNHRTRFDWLFLFCYILRFGNLSKYKIILKSSLKRVPIFGWAIQAAQFMFLSRNWSTDEKYMTESLTYFTSQCYPLQLLIFPEGTDLSESNKIKSHKFAEEHGLQKYNHVLHPKTKGFVHCIQMLRQGGRPVSVYNMTVGYIGAIPQNEIDIVTGNWPNEIHFNCTYVPPSQLPLQESELEDWLKACWQQKESQLVAFYVNGHFDAPYLQERCSQAQLLMAVTLIAWLVFHIIIFYCLYASSLLRWYYFGATVLFSILIHCTEGLETRVLRLYK